MSYQTKRVGLRNIISQPCVFMTCQNRIFFDRAKMKLTGHFDWIHFLRYSLVLIVISKKSEKYI